jgi:hypothetical protein
MKAPLFVVGALLLALFIPTNAAAKKKKSPRGMIESMQSLPCGMKEKGLNGLGSLWASVGVTSVSSNEKLCPQYLFRTDELEYHIRPDDTKHPVILPIGHEAEYRIHKDKIFLKVPDGDKKTHAYHVVAMEPIKTASAEENSAYRPAAHSSTTPSATTAPAAMPAENGSPAALPQRANNQNMTPPPSPQTQPQH